MLRFGAAGLGPDAIRRLPVGPGRYSVNPGSNVMSRIVEWPVRVASCRTYEPALLSLETRYFAFEARMSFPVADASPCSAPVELVGRVVSWL